MGKQIEKEQGNLSQYHERQAKVSAQSADLENQLVAAQQLLVQKEQERQDATADKKVLEQECVAVKKDIEDIDIAIQKLEQEKTNRDHTIHTLNDEVAGQDEVINKLNKEKKYIGENQSKAAEDLQAAEDKVNHLSSIKSKLESTLDELEDSANREKRGRGDMEKQRRKLEGELKIAQETVVDLENAKRDLENIIARKEKDTQGASAKLEDEQGMVGKMQKSIKECQGRVEELEEELEAERQARAKAERQRSDLARELEELGERLDEAGGATSAQMELNKKRENEVGKMRKDCEEINIQHESVLTKLKRKHQDAIQEMTEQIDQLTKMKGKIDKDKGKIGLEANDARAATDEVGRARASSEKNNKNLLAQLNELNKKIEEANMTLGDFEGAKRKVAAENGDLLRGAGDVNNNMAMIQKANQALVGNLDEAKRVADDEARERHLLLGKYRNIEHELDGVKDNLEEEVASREDVCRQVNKS